MAKNQPDELIWRNSHYPNRARPDEDIVLVVREDIIVLAYKAFAFFIVFFVFLLVRVVLLGVFDLTAMAVYDTFFFSITTVLITGFTLVFHNYYLSLQIITNQRIVDIDQKGLFIREVNELPLDNIEDVNHKQTGLLGTVFNFGNVIVKTAGENGGGRDTEGPEDSTNGFTFNNVPHPDEVAATITTLYHSAQDDERMKTAQANAEALKTVLRDQTRPPEQKQQVL